VSAPARSAESSQALDRGLRLLRLLAAAEGGLTVSQLADGLGTSRAAVYRLVTALAGHGMVRRPADGRVRLGLGLLELARRVLPELRDAAREPLRGLAERAGATAHLTVLDGAEALAVAVVEPSWTDFHVAYRVGIRHPLHRGAAGRAILLGREGTGDGPGYVVTSGELQAGARGIAAPLPDGTGLEASVGVVALVDLDPAEVGPLVRAAAAAVAERLR